MSTATTPRIPRHPEINWADVYHAIGEIESDNRANEVFFSSPDFQFQNGEPVTMADYEKAFLALEIPTQADAIKTLAQTDPEMAAAVVNASEALSFNAIFVDYPTPSSKREHGPMSSASHPFDDTPMDHTDAEPDVDWVKAYRACSDGLEEEGWIKNALMVYESGPDFRYDNGEAVEMADYAKAFRELAPIYQDGGLVHLCKTDPALAADVVTALDPFEGVQAGVLLADKESARLVIEAIKMMRANHLFNGPEPFTGIIADLKRALFESRSPITKQDTVESPFPMLDRVTEGNVKIGEIENWKAVLNRPNDGAMVMVAVSDNDNDRVRPAIYTGGVFNDSESPIDGVLAWQYLDEARMSVPF